MKTVAPLTSESTVSFCSFTFSGTYSIVFSLTRNYACLDLATVGVNSRQISRCASRERVEAQNFRCPPRRRLVVLALGRTQERWRCPFLACPIKNGGSRSDQSAAGRRR